MERATRGSCRFRALTAAVAASTIAGLVGFGARPRPPRRTHRRCLSPVNCRTAGSRLPDRFMKWVPRMPRTRAPAGTSAVRWAAFGRPPSSCWMACGSLPMGRG